MITAPSNAMDDRIGDAEYRRDIAIERIEVRLMDEALAGDHDGEILDFAIVNSVGKARTLMDEFLDIMQARRDTSLFGDAASFRVLASNWRRYCSEWAKQQAPAVYAAERQAMGEP